MNNYIWFGIFVSANVLLTTLLALNVSLTRIRLKIANGDGDNIEMKKAIRAHGNNVEHVPIFGLVVLALVLLGSSNLILGLL